MELSETDSSLIYTDRLVKSYGDHAVVRGVDLRVNAGEIVGLLGPNGAGKTTSFYMIVGLVRPTGDRSFLRGRMSHVCRCFSGLGWVWAIWRRSLRFFEN